MFKDLLSNLPQNPTVRADILFYSARLREESGVRLIGFVFLLLAAFVQLSAAAYHPPKSLAGAPSLDGLTPAAYAYCTASTNFLSGSARDFTIITAVHNNQIPVAAYQYDIDANGTVDHYDATSQNPHSRNIIGLPNGSHSISVTVFMLTPDDNKIHHYTICQTSITINPQAKVVTSKSVSNTTKGQSNANGQTANAGDQLVFKMTTQNVTSTDYQNYTGRDFFGVVLQYADIVNPAELSKQGIVLDANNYLNWTTLNLKGNATEVKTITVKVKNPLPVKTANNCIITNAYGNQVAVNLACPASTPTPTPTPPPAASTTLPNTGPGTTVAIAFVVATTAGYFFSRSRLMAHELELAVDNNHHVGELQ